MNAVSQEVALLLERHAYYGLHSAVAKATASTPSSVAGWATGEVTISAQWWPEIQRFFDLDEDHLQKIHDGVIAVGSVEGRITGTSSKAGRPPADAKPSPTVSQLLGQLVEQQQRTTAVLERLLTEFAALRRELPSPKAPTRGQRPKAS